nr:PREDICTED: E3 ubiquitin-protein ligase TRIM41-like [Latimeria chalumnae]|eukprot:XP_014347025.1 PREDICTED: E3 ubiquitin-protein ligase TRIM41-like [Latimeria chalumnae]
MDSKSSTGGLEDDITCSVCQELFKDPVTLRYGHNFCRECVCEYWKGKTSQSCPICSADSAISELKINYTLRNIVEMYKKEGKKSKAQSKSICSEHEEKLKLYCLEDQEAICLVCQTSRKHKNHTFLPIEEAAQEFKDKPCKIGDLVPEIVIVLREMVSSCKDTLNPGMNTAISRLHYVRHDINGAMEIRDELY